MSTPRIPTPEAGDTPTSGDKIPSQKLANASRAPAVTADVTESREGGAEPDRPAAQQAAPSHPPGNRRANAASTAQVDAMPRWLRRQIEQVAGAYVPLPNAVTRASGAHLEPVGQHELDDDAKIPEFLRRQGVKPSDFVPRELRTAEAVTFPVTLSQAPASASVTPTVTAAPPVVGSICPTCHCRVPARLSDAERQRASRARKREQGKLVVP